MEVLKGRKDEKKEQKQSFFYFYIRISLHWHRIQVNIDIFLLQWEVTSSLLVGFLINA